MIQTKNILSYVSYDFYQEIEVDYVPFCGSLTVGLSADPANPSTETLVTYDISNDELSFQTSEEATAGTYVFYLTFSHSYI